MKNKLIDLEQAVSMIKAGDVVMVGGFLGVGSPHTLIDAIIKHGKAKDLTIICNDTGLPNHGVSRLISAGLVKKVIASHIGTNPQTGELMNKGELIVDLVPQGTLIERIRAGGFGLGGILTPTGVGTDVALNKQIINVDGKDYLLEKPLKADVGLIFGSIVDKLGNVVYKGTTKNFNPFIACASQLVICEAQNLVEVGEIEPHNVATQSIFVDYVVSGRKN